MAGWINFRLLKQAVSICEVLDHYRIALKPSGPGSLRGCCPLPMHSSTSPEASFMVNVSKNVWACHSQSCIHARRGATGGNILDLVCLMEGCSLRSAGLLIQSWSQPVNTQNAIRPRQVGPCGSQGVTTNPKLAFRLEPIQFHHPYLKRRCVEPLVAERFGIGFYTGAGSMHGRVVIPVHDQRGALVAYVGRSIDNTQPRYRFPSGFRKSLELYNLHRCSGMSVVLVEGFFDTLSVVQAGFDAVALMGVALGATKGYADRSILRRHPPVGRR